VRQAVRHYLLALQYFTRIPLPEGVARWVGFNATLQQASLAHFPGVGCLVGAATGALFYMAALCLPLTSVSPWLAACLSTVLSVMLTGAFHEDGLADTSDGLGGMVARTRALEIMKDSRIGSYGAVALVLAITTKLALLTMLGQIDFALAAWSLFAAHVCSRVMPLLIAARLSNVGGDLTTKTKPLANKVSRQTLFVALVWLLLAYLLFSSQHATILLLWATGCSLCAWWLMLRLLTKRLNGFTGDTLGATQQVCELAFYLGILLGLPR